MTIKPSEWVAMSPAAKAQYIRDHAQPKAIQGLPAQAPKGKKKKRPRKVFPEYVGPLRRTLIINGKPAPKKSQNATGRKNSRGQSIVYEEPRHRLWRNNAEHQLRELRHVTPTLTCPVRLSVTYYEHPRQRFDIAGVFQALCDVLQDAEVYANDRQVRESGPMAILRDVEDPRIVCVIETIEDIP